jgi:HAD superfamily hydrolase (TIGR01509 family)
VRRAVLFDLDGTLLDSVDLHARAWQEAFARFGKDVPYAAVRAQIGKGGDQLVSAFLDPDEVESFGDDLDRYRGELFARSYLPHVRPFPQARALVARARAEGLRVGLASSCKQSELEHHLDLLEVRALIDAATTADDVDRSKPYPDVFLVCAERLGVAPPDAVAVGDSPFDAIAAARAGIPTVGLLSGGFPRRTLEEAGCVAVYSGPADLLLRFDGSPLAPGAGDRPAA